jgi:multidrug resistance efflux pump
VVALPRIFNIFSLLFFSFFLFSYLVLKVIKIDSYSEKSKGVIISNNEPKKISARVASNVGDIFVVAGQSVNKGDILARLNNPLLAIELSEYEAELYNLKESLNFERENLKLAIQRKEITSQLLTLKEQESDLRKAKQSIVSKLAIQQATIPQIDSLETLSKQLGQELINPNGALQLSTLERLNYLEKVSATVDKVLSSKQAVRTADIDLASEDNRSGIELATLKLSLVESDIKVSEHKKNVAKLLADISSKSAAIEEVHQQYQYLELKAPIDGVVTYISPTLLSNNIVQPSEDLLVVSPFEYSLFGQLFIDDKLYKDISIGDEVNLELFAWNHRKHGIIKGDVTAITNTKVSLPTQNGKAFIATLALRERAEQRLELERGFTFVGRVKLGKVSLFQYIISKINSDV